MKRLFLFLLFLISVNADALIKQSGTTLVYNIRNKEILRALSYRDNPNYVPLMLTEEGLIIIRGTKSRKSMYLRVVDENVRVTSDIVNATPLVIVQGRYLRLASSVNGYIIWSEGLKIGHPDAGEMFPGVGSLWDITCRRILDVPHLCQYYHKFAETAGVRVTSTTKLYFHPRSGISTVLVDELGEADALLTLKDGELCLSGGEHASIAISRGVVRITYGDWGTGLITIRPSNDLVYVENNTKYRLVTEGGHLTFKKEDWNLEELELFTKNRVYLRMSDYTFYSSNGATREKCLVRGGRLKTELDENVRITINNGVIKRPRRDAPFLSFNRGPGNSWVAKLGEENYVLKQVKGTDIIVFTVAEVSSTSSSSSSSSDSSSN